MHTALSLNDVSCTHRQYNTMKCRRQPYLHAIPVLESAGIPSAWLLRQEPCRQLQSIYRCSSTKVHVRSCFNNQCSLVCSPAYEAWCTASLAPGAARIGAVESRALDQTATGTTSVSSPIAAEIPLLEGAAGAPAASETRNGGCQSCIICAEEHHTPLFI
jgi:hypothetical protein